jgi:hypothetical protein
MSTLLPLNDRPATSASPLPGRWIDPRGQRFGAGLSAAVLVIAAALDLVWLVALVMLALAVSSAFGTRWFIFGRPWPALRRVLRLAPSEPEHEYPPRFAQALGSIFLAVGLVSLVVGIEPWGWLPVVAVIALQLLLAITGYCLGCRLYGLRWIGPALFVRLVGRRFAAR